MSFRAKRGIFYNKYTKLRNASYEHQTGLIQGFTKKYQIKYLVYFEEYNNVNEAIDREKILKGWARKKKLDLIYIINPYWNDLSKMFGC